MKYTQQQMLDAAAAAGLLPNTIQNWMPALQRYHEELQKLNPAVAVNDLLSTRVLHKAAQEVEDSANVWTGFAYQDAKGCVTTAIQTADPTIKIKLPGFGIWADDVRKDEDIYQ